jgi:uncharacterized protein (DUF1697 family)
MTAYVALLRAVNVGGRNKVAMSPLRDMVAGLGFTDVSTLLQSGNVIFHNSDRQRPNALEALLEQAAKEHLGLETDFLVRSAEEWSKIVAANPFAEQASRDPSHLVVMALKEAPGKGAVDRLRAAIVGRETVQADGRTAYIVYPDGIGRSKLTAGLIEKQLGTRGTGRNWNTVLKLAAKL